MQLSPNTPFGEIVSSTLQECTVQSWTWDQHPSYGSFLSIHDHEHQYAAIIYSIETTPLDTMRTPIAYKKNHAELLAEHPHIFSLLRTIMRCTLLGIYLPQYLSPIVRTPRIHSFSSLASTQELSIIIQTTTYIRTIINTLEPAIADTLIYALIAQHRKNSMDRTHLNKIIKEYILCIGNDYRRIHNLNAHIHNVF